MEQKKRDIMLDEFPDEEILTADGFDDAIIGRCEFSGRIIYSVSKCLDILVSEGMTEEDALEHFYFNVAGAYVGELTPIWCQDYMYQYTEEEENPE